MSIFLGGMSGSCNTRMGAVKVYPDILKRGQNIWFKKGNILVNFQGKSSNDKTGVMVQNYLIPVSWAKAGVVLPDDTEVCFDCPHSQGKNATCYVRKGSSQMGLFSKMRSLRSFWKDIPEYNSKTEEALLKMCEGREVRFGAYGEPILLGEELVKKITSVAKTWTGYTHQWHKPEYAWAKRYFMASVDGEFEKRAAQADGWRVFFVTDNANTDPSLVSCPASAEMNKVSTCAKCSMCKGTSSKAKSIKIIKHSISKKKK